ncbi:MAG: hypothetical protein HYZ29_28135 [Myxococcales bacterium]|nr:hypothetical protein [Myxococcales bacterium]
MRGWQLLACAVVACSSTEAPPEPVREREARLLPFPESDLPSPSLLGSAALPGGRRVEARAGAEPGESDLWSVDANGSAAPLAAAPGPDEGPVALPDGRVAFVSGRSTVMSVWLVDPSTAQTTQLTNRGLRAGTPWSSFVPPPAHGLEVDGRMLRWEDANGQSYQVEVAP